LRSGLYTEPHWGAYSTPPEPVAVGEEAICPSPRIPPLLSAVGLEFFALRASGFPRRDMGYVSNQNCCKGLHFTEKVEKH